MGITLGDTEQRGRKAAFIQAVCSGVFTSPATSLGALGGGNGGTRLQVSGSLLIFFFFKSRNCV